MSSNFSEVVLWAQIASMAILWIGFRYTEGKVPFWRQIGLIAAGMFAGRYIFRLYETWSWDELLLGAHAAAFWLVVAMVFESLLQLSRDAYRRVFRRKEKTS